MDSRILEMQEEFSKSRAEILPSKFWLEYNKMNVEQLQQYGYENFKRTLALNYFTFVSGFRDPQISHLFRNLPLPSILAVLLRTLLSGKHDYLPLKGSINYNLLTYLVWEFVSRHDPERLLKRLHEPEEGNPPRILINNKLISQDLANSVLEYYSIMHPSIVPSSIKRVIELGAGYGRTAYVILSLLPHVKYVVVDIPPALYVSERYLSSQFQDKRIFKFRKFQDYSDIKEEYEQADIAFLLPSQMELLPDKSSDMFLNISSLHEMRQDQIDYYLDQIARLTSQYFYFKQWKESKNRFDNSTITEADYPIPATWSKIYWQECKIQTKMFEALFKL
jgi:putative sugar O-methyltransferase